MRTIYLERPAIDAQPVEQRIVVRRELFQGHWPPGPWGSMSGRHFLVPHGQQLSAPEYRGAPQSKCSTERGARVGSTGKIYGVWRRADRSFARTGLENNDAKTSFCRGTRDGQAGRTATDDAKIGADRLVRSTLTQVAQAHARMRTEMFIWARQQSRGAMA